ncbi:MAG: family N-acetyltransferase [Thermoleophilia bacterium]|nr:family N-acetyltransferase [Thermoleophilia bacterium]
MTAAPPSPEDEREAYAAFLALSRQRSVFAEPWWLDATTGSARAWSPNLLRAADGSVRAAWPLPVRPTRVGLVGTTAPYTPWLGPLLPDAAPGVARTSADVELLEALAASLVGHAHVEAACLPELDYWTPLSWHGFEQTTRTTWRLAHAGDVDATRAAMRKGTRRKLSIAERDALVVEEGSVADLLVACEATFAQQGAAVPAAAALDRAARAALERERGTVLVVRSAEGTLAAAGLFVEDDRRSYAIAYGRGPGEDVDGASTLLLWAGIRRAAERGLGFDFEGSMIRSIERFVRGFGGEPHAYSVVRRSSPAWARTVARRRRVKRLLRR